MADNGTELRAIAWTQAFPFVRLFRSLPLALDLNRLGLALACVLVCYVGGRILDGLWLSGDGGVAVSTDGAALTSEIQVYASGPQSQFEAWRRSARAGREQVAVGGLMAAGLAKDVREARAKLEQASWSLEDLLVTDAFRQDRAWARELIASRLESGLKAIDANAQLTAAEKAERRDRLVGAADTLRRIVAGVGRYGRAGEPQRVAAMTALLTSDAQARAGQPAEEQARLDAVLRRQEALTEYEGLAPRGPFISLLDFESRCFAGAIQGVCAGRWGFAGGAFSAEPSMAASIVSAWRGVAWVFTQRPWFGLLCGLFHLVVFALFGGAICRSAAVQSARDESIRLREALGFAWGKLSGLLVAPLMPAALAALVAVLLFLGGLVGTIPWVGELLTGVLYFLALLGGLVLALIVLAVVLGFHLMWPTIAAEGSDGFDAMSRAFSYVGSRIWHVGFYSLVLLVYGAFSFVLVRLVALLGLKLAHGFTGWGMNLVSSAELSGAGKLEALWSMPAWADLTLLPSTQGPPLWGSLFNGPLDATESIAAALLSFWVFLVVGLVAAFAVSYFFCGSTQMYFLLRRDIDATDYDEVYYEEPAEELPPTTEPAPAAAAEAGAAAPAADAPGPAPEPPPPPDGGAPP